MGLKPVGPHQRAFVAFSGYIWLNGSFVKWVCQSHACYLRERLPWGLTPVVSSRFAATGAYHSGANPPVSHILQFSTVADFPKQAMYRFRRTIKTVLQVSL